MSRSSEKAAFAGLVDGNFTASIPTLSRQYRLYILYEVAPFAKILVTEVSATSPAISFGTTELMGASDEPVISHEPKHPIRRYYDLTASASSAVPLQAGRN